ncbi:MAG: class I SAM-dependent methyltransferase [Phycisphaerales bacterium]|nr:class I SAM-dependent methyltransferase [Phycisphaerales bacterium]
MPTSSPSLAAPASSAAPDYRAIYDHIMATHPGYGQPGTSPGCHACWMESPRLRAAGGPALDVGCGMGFAVELLRGPHFGIDARGVDVSPVAVEAGNRRIGGEALSVMNPGSIPAADGRYALVTCFDVLEHLDEADVLGLRDELRRVLRPGGLLYCSVATRAAGSTDRFGDNLHRTVRPPEWWSGVLDADEIRWFRRAQDLYLFWRKPG